ncbi:hypothetical protein G7K_5445-t1 [Saitoella complicata NRRL Y-17804]|uniref:Uncharacterized protein n=1 Tax=Saitoella complicata (strain BCRC 22490 / CBS 7301 / JCM 7358 / NBRC 10748 / NRRL Y-17804) TaxID=698492 RepID=A0A0E9NNE5_SAICN|nr:hypothetical protein G7K_5445-t1 [Saitoella complicata NRRL Y-17804]
MALPEVGNDPKFKVASQSKQLFTVNSHGKVCPSNAATRTHGGSSQGNQFSGSPESVKQAQMTDSFRSAGVTFVALSYLSGGQTSRLRQLWPMTWKAPRTRLRIHGRLPSQGRLSQHSVAVCLRTDAQTLKP